MKDFNPGRYAADELGLIQAEIAELREKERKLKALLISNSEKTGDTSIEGELYRATISESERNTVNWKKIASDLGASPQRIRANTSTTEVVSVRVTARSTDRKAA